MADPIEFYGSNAKFTPAAGDEEAIGTMPAFSNGMEVITCWKLSEIERQKAFETGEVWLSHLTGGGPFHPVQVSGLPLMFLIDPDTKMAIDGYRTDGNHQVSEAAQQEE